MIEDRARGTHGRFEGAAEFAAAGTSLLYRETGRLMVEAYEGEAFRAYRFDFPAPTRALVAFEDGRAFHDLDLSSGSWEARHACNPDRYDGRFTASGANGWESVWRIEGPRKDLVLTTVYARV